MKFEISGKRGDSGARRLQEDGGAGGGGGGGQGARRLLVLGDFGGRQSRDRVEVGAALAQRPLVRVRQESFDAAVTAIAPRLTLPAALVGTGVPLAIEALDDLHPDRLFRRIAIFHDPAPAPAPPPAGVVVVCADDADDLARLLGRRPSTVAAPVAAATPTAAAAVDSLIGQILGKHAASSPPVAGPLDPAPLGRAMRAVLHAPFFQALEARWRALELLVSRTEEEVEVWLLDVSKPELLADLMTAGTVEDSALAQRLLAAPGGPGRRWTALIGDFAFGPGVEDVALLERLGALAARLRAPFVAGASGALIGLPAPSSLSVAAQDDPARWPALTADETARWQALRRGPSAAWLGLALPRFLARAPYGARSGAGAIEAFAFEEIEGRPPADALTWAGSSFLCGLVLARGGDDPDADTSDTSDDANEIDDLPFFSFRADGDVEMYPTAEVFWGQRAADALLARGLMPVLTIRDRNAVRVARLQSIADPPTALGDGSAGDPD